MDNGSRRVRMMVPFQIFFFFLVSAKQLRFSTFNKPKQKRTHFCSILLVCSVGRSVARFAVDRNICILVRKRVFVCICMCLDEKEVKDNESEKNVLR